MISAVAFTRRLFVFPPIYLFVAAAIGCLAVGRARGQIVTTVGNAPGVYVDVDGTLKRRLIDDREELASMRTRLRATQDAAKSEKMAFVSLPKAFAAARAAVDAGQPIPDDLKYLGGLTQIRFVFLYPESNDLVIAGPAEVVQVVDELHARGKLTGRPVLRMEDFVVAMRVTREVGRGTFGCRLDPDPAAPARVHKVMQELAQSSRAERIKAVAKAIGPQKVSFFGNVPDDTRFALVMVAADYELKRYALGLAKTTLGDLGNIVDNTRAAVNMIWYELAYQPILVSPNGDAYGLRGQRLKVQAGSFDWDPKGATPKAFQFAGRMTKSIDTLAINQPLIAELQNLADLSVVSGLIQRDRLDDKVHWDTTWLRRESADSERAFPLTKVTVPKEAEALSTYTNGSIAGGGVVLSPVSVITAQMESDTKKTMDPAKQLATKLRAESPDAAIWGKP